MPLSYTSGYSSVKPASIQQQDADPFAKALEEVQVRKQQREQRQQKLIASREQFAKDEYYGKHADFLRNASEELISKEDDFARDDVSMQKYIEAWQNLGDLADMFKTFKTNTYGSVDDDPSDATFIAAEKRSRGVDPYAADGLEATVDFNQMTNQLNELNNGLFDVKVGDDLQLLIDGEPLSQADFGTNANPFDPVLNVADISGGAFFRSIYRPGREMTDKGIEAEISTSLLNNKDSMIKAVNHYIRTAKKENPEYSSTAQDILNDESKRQEVVDQYIQEAKEYYNQIKPKQRTSEADKRLVEKKQEFISSIKTNGSVRIVGEDDQETDNAALSYIGIGNGEIIYIDNDYNPYFVNNKGQETSLREGDARIIADVNNRLGRIGLSLDELLREMQNEE